MARTPIGAVPGGVIFSHFSHYSHHSHHSHYSHYSHYSGRMRELTFTFLMLLPFSGLRATAQCYWGLLAYRTLAGMGLGGEFGIGMSPIAAFPVLNCAAPDSGICLLSLYAPPHYVRPFSADSLRSWPEP